MADPIKERLERREQQHDLIREQVEIEMLRDGSQQAATVRNRDGARSQDVAKTRGDLTRVAESTRSNTPRTDKAAKSERSAEKPNAFKIADGHRLNDVMAGRARLKAPPAEAARIRRADARAEVKAPRPAAETARPSGATRIAQDRAVQGRREAALAERPRTDQLPREQAHLRPQTLKPPQLQKANLAARFLAYVTKLLKPTGPSSAEQGQPRQLQASISQKKLLQQQGPSGPGASAKSGATQSPGSPAIASRTSLPGTKESGPVTEAGHLICYDGKTGDPKTLAEAANFRDAFCRLGAGDSPLVFDLNSWHEVQQERSRPIQVRLASNGNADHRRVEALRGRQAKT